MSGRQNKSIGDERAAAFELQNSVESSPSDRSHVRELAVFSLKTFFGLECLRENYNRNTFSPPTMSGVVASHLLSDIEWALFEPSDNGFTNIFSLVSSAYSSHSESSKKEVSVAIEVHNSYFERWFSFDCPQSCLMAGCRIRLDNK